MDSKLLLLISTLAIAGTFMAFNSNQSNMTTAFEEFKLKQGKVYAHEAEEAYRFAIYV